MAKGRGGKGGKRAASQRQAGSKPRVSADSADHQMDKRTRNQLRRHRKRERWVPVLDDDDVKFDKQLRPLGLRLKDMRGDGNCLFRSLADQLWGDASKHPEARATTCRYMREHEEDFAPFIDTDEWGSFKEYMDDLEKMGTYADNDAIAAFSRLHGVDIELHQIGQPRWVIRASDAQAAPRCLHIAYHSYEHYSSVREIGQESGAADVKIDAESITRAKASAAATDKSTSDAFSPESAGQDDSRPSMPTSNNARKRLERKLKKEAKRKHLEQLKAEVTLGSTQSTNGAKQEDSGDEKGAFRHDQLASKDRNEDGDCEEVSDSLEACILEATGCKDVSQARLALASCDGDVDAAISHLLQVMELGAFASSVEGGDKPLDRAVASHDHESCQATETNKSPADDEDADSSNMSSEHSNRERPSISPQQKSDSKTQQERPQREAVAVPLKMRSPAKQHGRISNRQRKELARREKQLRKAREHAQQVAAVGSQHGDQGKAASSKDLQTTLGTVTI